MASDKIAKIIAQEICGFAEQASPILAGIETNKGANFSGALLLASCLGCANYKCALMLDDSSQLC